MLPTVAAFLTYLKGLAPKNRTGLAFGSYGWGGQSVGQVEEKLASCGFTMLESIKVKYIPDEAVLSGITRKTGKGSGAHNVVNDIKEILVKNGISPSYHRLKIYEYLLNNRSTHRGHDLRGRHKNIPTLSKTTIYNTLKTFAEKGLVSSITIEDNEVRYDADISLHGHFKCISLRHAL